MNKVKLISTLLFLFLAVNSIAQRMNFQGKIFYTGNPFNGMATMKFLINDPPFSWSDTENVVITNGLYSCVIGTNTPIPSTLFDSAHSSRPMIVYFNTNPIDTVYLYAPFERDPSVRRYIRDSITWQNVHNKPTIDTSFTNENQTLSLSNDTLTISNGNSVIISSLQDTLGTTTINGNLTIIDSSISNMISLSTGGSIMTFPPNISVWQSFKATANGKLRNIKVYMGSTVPSVNFYLYNNQAPGTTAISPSPVAITGVPSSTGWFTINLSQANFILNSGNVYTFMITPASGGQITSQLQINPYPGGIAGSYNLSISSNTNYSDSDITFSINIDNSTPPCLTFGNNCYVGVGTNNPTSQLEVKGRIKDQSGWLMPVGVILPYGGKKVDPSSLEGWLICDGRAVSRTTYADLFEVIDTSWGKGDGFYTFNLPDLRGMFMRGVDSSSTNSFSGNDPDRYSRSTSAGGFGGNSGNQVGSKQGDLIISHNHDVIAAKVTSPGGLAPGGSGSSINGNFTITSTSVGGSETRPKNVYVYYIIKY